MGEIWKPNYKQQMRSAPFSAEWTRGVSYSRSALLLSLDRFGRSIIKETSRGRHHCSKGQVVVGNYAQSNGRGSQPTGTVEARRTTTVDWSVPSGKHILLYWLVVEWRIVELFLEDHRTPIGDHSTMMVGIIKFNLARLGLSFYGLPHIKASVLMPFHASNIRRWSCNCFNCRVLLQLIVLPSPCVFREQQ